MADYMIVVAAGSGSRYGGTLPKQFCDLNGRPLLMTTLERLKACSPDCELIVVLSSEMMPLWEEMSREAGFEIVHTVVEGGATRALSVRNAVDLIRSLPGEKRYIGVHDAARPVVTAALIDSLFEGLADGKADGAIPATPLTDSIRLLHHDGHSEAADRSHFRAVQTPQIFPADRLMDAYARMLPSGGNNGCNPSTQGGNFTDDASVMEAAGYSNLRLTPGDSRNVKVTNPGDMAIASLFLHGI